MIEVAAVAPQPACKVITISVEAEYACPTALSLLAYSLVNLRDSRTITRRLPLHIVASAGRGDAKR
jgi:hypothetical protein